MIFMQLLHEWNACMNLEALQLLGSVVHGGSFAAAARENDSDPSLVSRKISLLEKELGFRLFQRTTRRLALTEAGQIYWNRIAPIIEELEHARDAANAVSEQPGGVLRFTTSVAFGHACILPLIGEFRRQFPNIRLDLVFEDRNLDLVAERIDLGIRLGTQVDGDLITAKLFDTTYHICASPDYLSKSPPLDTPTDLIHHRCLLFSFASFRTEWHFEGKNGDHLHIPVEGDVWLSGGLSLRDCALSGLGPALMPDWLTRPLIASGQLVRLFPDFTVYARSPQTAAWFIYPSRSFLPKKVRAMIQFLRQQLTH
jgi:DNA-binding transcriptional LysR family regulator